MIPPGAVHLHLIKTLETEILNRRMLDGGSSLFNPLWFLAETERNVFLWRRGCSIIQEDEFEFWVDIPALIEKRLGQLSRFDGENPFMNPLWGLSIADKETATKEERYLQSLFELINDVLLHLEALSIAASRICREESAAGEKEVVVLPVKHVRQ